MSPLVHKGVHRLIVSCSVFQRMNAIVGLTAIAGANVESQDRVIECLGKITESSRHLLGLINEVLDMARIESGKMTLAQEDFNLSELVDNLITLTKPVLDEHKHNFDIHINHIEHLRHVFARSYYEDTKALAGLADLLGHSSVNVTRIYTLVWTKEE